MLRGARGIVEGEDSQGIYKLRSLIADAQYPDTINLGGDLRLRYQIDNREWKFVSDFGMILICIS